MVILPYRVGRRDRPGAGRPDRYGLMAVHTHVRIGASDGAIALTGHVRTWSEHAAVIDDAWPGVGVRNSPRLDGGPRLIR